MRVRSPDFPAAANCSRPENPKWQTMPFSQGMSARATTTPVGIHACITLVSTVSNIGFVRLALRNSWKTVSREPLTRILAMTKIPQTLTAMRDRHPVEGHGAHRMSNNIHPGETCDFCDPHLLLTPAFLTVSKHWLVPRRPRLYRPLLPCSWFESPGV